MSEWKETEVGRIPEAWDCNHIGEFGDVTKLAGFEYTKYITYVEDGEIIALRALNVREGQLDLSDVKKIYRSVSEELPRSKLYKNDILFTYVGANIGQFALIPEDEKFHLAPNICRIRCGEKSYPYFVYSYFRTTFFRESLDGFSHGSSQPTLPMKSIRQIPVPLPPLPEQKAIGSVLSSLDDKIDLLHRQNKTLESMAETLFRQWFIEEAEDDWEEKPLSTFGQIICGKTPSKKKPDFYGGDIQFIKIPDMHGKTYIFETTDNLSEEGKASQEKKTIPINSICVSCIATVGLVVMTSQPCQTNQQINSIVPERINTLYYLYLTMKSSYDLLHAMASGGTATLNLNTGNFSKIPVPCPTNEILDSFHDTVDPLYLKIFNNQTQIQTLEKLRDTLLSKLMSGEVRVKYAQDN